MEIISRADLYRMTWEARRSEWKGTRLDRASDECDCPLAQLQLDTPRAAEEEEIDYPVGSPRVLRWYRESFDKKDYGRRGEIETKELRSLMASVGRELTDQAARLLLQQLDRDGSGTISFEEWLGGCFHIREPREGDPPPASEEDKAFRRMCDCIYRDDPDALRRLIVDRAAAAAASSRSAAASRTNTPGSHTGSVEGAGRPAGLWDWSAEKGQTVNMGNGGGGPLWGRRAGSAGTAVHGGSAPSAAAVAAAAEGARERSTGMGLLHVAALRGFERTTSLLLEVRCDVNSKTAAGRTPLHYAAESSHPGRRRCIAALLAAGANPAAADGAGRTPAERLVGLHAGSGFEWLDDRRAARRFARAVAADGGYGYHHMVAVTAAGGGGGGGNWGAGGEQEEVGIAMDDRLGTSVWAAEAVAGRRKKSRHRRREEQ